MTADDNPRFMSIATKKYVRKLLMRISQSETDALTMALRLYGEPEDSLSPKCREVMARWGKRVEAILEQPTNNL